jgi:F0F1-type ATP synthase alpha subunit
VPEQIVALSAVTAGLLDRLPLDLIQEAKGKIREAFGAERDDLVEKLARGHHLTEDERGGMHELVSEIVQELTDGDQTEARA